MKMNWLQGLGRDLDRRARQPIKFRIKFIKEFFKSNLFQQRRFIFFELQIDLNLFTFSYDQFT